LKTVTEGSNLHLRIGRVIDVGSLFQFMATEGED